MQTKEPFNIYQTTREYAAFYQSLGLDPLPIPPVNGKPSKAPRTPGWPELAAKGYSLDDFHDGDNIGGLMGGEKHIHDIDGDDEIAREMAKTTMLELFPELFRFGRQSNDWSSHYIFCCQKSLPSIAIKDPVNGKVLIELRCVKQDGSRGFQTVLPGSTHPSGERIAFHPNSAKTIPIVEAESLRKIVSRIGAACLTAKYFPLEGDRHRCILAWAGAFCRGGKTIEFATRFISLAYQHSAGYNHDLSKVEADVESVYRTFERSPDTHLYGIPTLLEIMHPAVVNKVLELLDVDKHANPELHQSYSPDDTGNGKRFVDEFANRVRYCVDVWYVYDGRRWRRDDAQAIRELAKQIGPMIEAEANKLTSPVITGDEERDVLARRDFQARKKILLKWASQTNSVKGINNMLIAASSDPRIACRPQGFDTQQNLLNCPNGVVDLESGELLPHHPDLMLSQLCPTEYHPDAIHPVWEESLDAYTRKHPDLREWLQRAFGYSIQGRKSEELIFVAHGPGASGKSTIFAWLQATLGSEYFVTMDPNSISRQKRDASGPSSDIVRLAGARMVVVSELEKHNQVQQAFLKSVSGGDKVVARGLHRAEVEIPVTWQFWILTNYRPGFDAQDSGNLRRYLEIPFDNELTKDPLVQLKKGLKSQMAADDRFKQAILAWAVEGSIAWHKHGLSACSSVQQATKELFKSNDFLSEFLQDHIHTTNNPKDMVTVAQLRKVYEDWCMEQGEQPASGRVFNTMLEERGFVRKQALNPKTGLNKKHWLGIRIKLPFEHLSPEKVQDFDGLREVLQ